MQRFCSKLFNCDCSNLLPNSWQNRPRIRTVSRALDSHIPEENKRRTASVRFQQLNLLAPRAWCHALLNDTIMLIRSLCLCVKWCIFIQNDSFNTWYYNEWQWLAMIWKRQDNVFNMTQVVHKTISASYDNYSVTQPRLRPAGEVCIQRPKTLPHQPQYVMLEVTKENANTSSQTTDDFLQLFFFFFFLRVE